jgi:hypothetical protein
MNDFEAIKNLSLPEVEQKIEANRKEIKITRAITYVFDVIIIMVAGLYVLDINFSKWLMIPAAASVTLHTRLSILYERKCVLKQQEVILKYLRK